MRTLAVVAAVSLLSGAAVARAHAQEPAAPVDEREKAANEAPRHLQVLQNPYDISSFYRSSQSPAGFGYEPMAPSRYPIAGFYRSQHAPGTYGMFWTSGYGRGYGMGRGRGRGPLGAPRTRALGLNGDLCLFAPTFLAPVGPLTGTFFESR